MSYLFLFVVFIVVESYSNSPAVLTVIFFSYFAVFAVSVIYAAVLALITIAMLSFCILN